MQRKQRKIGDRVQLVIDEMRHLLGHSSNASADVARVRSLQLTKLEERVLMSASPMAMVAETLSPVAADSVSVMETGLFSNVTSPELETLIPSESVQSESGPASDSADAVEESRQLSAT